MLVNLITHNLWTCATNSSCLSMIKKLPTSQALRASSWAVLFRVRDTSRSLIWRRKMPLQCMGMQAQERPNVILIILRSFQVYTFGYDKIFFLCRLQIITDHFLRAIMVSIVLYFVIMIKVKTIAIISFFVVTLSQDSSLTSSSTEESGTSLIVQNISLIGLLLFLLILLAAIIIDRRNGSPFLTIIQRKAGEILQRIRNATAKHKLPKKEKLSGDQAIPTSKEIHNNMFDSQKTYVEAEPSSIQETVSLQKKLQAASSLELDDETPKVDLKEVFGQKDGQTSKRSKSKIRSRVQIKKSQRESQDSQQTEESKGNGSFEIASDVSKSQE